MHKSRNKSSRPATIADVARHAGVGAGTVSRVINGSKNVLDETRAHVMRSVKTLGYTPNIAAQSLAGGGLLRIAVLAGNPSSNYMSQFLLALLAHSYRRNCQILVQKFARAGSAAPTVETLLKNGVDGVILPPPLGDSRAIVDLLAQAGIPLVRVGTARPELEGLSVFIDNAAAMADATRYLLSLGHRQIGFVKGSAKQLDSAQRYEGFHKAMIQAGLEPNPDWIKLGNYTYQSGISAARSLLEAKKRPTAILASNDDMAAAVIAVAHRLNLDVPRDLTVAGFDDTPIATAIWPSLTTVRQPIAKMTRIGLDLIYEEIQMRRARKTLGPQQHCLKSRLIERDSSAVLG